MICIEKKSKEVFPRHEVLLCDSSGRADAADCCRGAPIARRTVNGCASPHTWTGALRSGAPPDGELNCLQMSLLPLRQQPEISTRIARLMTVERRLPNMHCAVDSLPSGKGASLRPRGLDLLLPKSLKHEQLQLEHYHMPQQTNLYKSHGRRCVNASHATR